MKYIILSEIKRTRRSMLLWCAMIVLLSLFGMIEYPFVSGNMDQLQPVFDSMPRIISIMFGVYGIDFTSPSGYYICLYFWCTLIAYIHAAYIGGSIVMKEMRDSTAEYLFTKPFTRSEVILAKTAAAAVNVLAVASAVTVCSLIILYMTHVSGNDFFYAVLSLSGMLVTQLCLAALAMLVSGLCSTYKKGTLAAMAMLTGSYLMFFLLEYVQAPALWNIVTPLRYFDAKAVIASGISPFYLLFAAGMIMASTGVSCMVYRRRESL